MGKSGSSAPAARALTKQELDLLESQKGSLDQATEVAAKQYNLSNEDREYVAQIYRGDLDPKDPRVKEEVAKRMSELKPPSREDYITYLEETSTGVSATPKTQALLGGAVEADGATTTTTKKVFNEQEYQDAVKEFNTNRDKLVREVSSDLGTAGVDELLFKAVTGSETEAGKLLSGWETSARELGTAYTDTLTGLSDAFKTSITTAAETYTGELEQAKGALGTADTDILGQQRGQSLAGISQSYQEAQKQLLAQTSQRGLAGSGIEAGALTSLLGQEAQQKAGALGQSYNQAIALSDQRRQQQLGIAGQQYGVSGQLASQLQQTGAQTGGGVYQTGLGTETSVLQNQLASQQQNLANLQLASGVSQGIFGQSQNYLQQAGATAGQAASTAGSTAVGLGANAVSYANAQAQAQASQGDLFGSILSAGVGAYTGGIGTGLATKTLG